MDGDSTQSMGRKSDVAGAQTQQILVSLMRTCWQQDQDPFTHLILLLRLPELECWTLCRLRLNPRFSWNEKLNLAHDGDGQPPACLRSPPPTQISRAALPCLSPSYRCLNEKKPIPLPAARVAGHRAQPIVELGHHETAGSGQVDLLLSLC